MSAGYKIATLEYHRPAHGSNTVNNVMTDKHAGVLSISVRQSGKHSGSVIDDRIQDVTEN